MIKDWLAEYNPKNKDEAQSALREVMQEVALAGLYRGGFFEKAAFYGGTALRIIKLIKSYLAERSYARILFPRHHGMTPSEDLLVLKVSARF